VITEELDQAFYCEQDDKVTNYNNTNSKNESNLIIPITSGAVALIVTIIIVVLLVICCWRRYTSLGMFIRLLTIYKA